MLNEMNFNEPKNKTAPEKAREIERDRRAHPESTVKGLARSHGVAASTVARILREAGLLVPSRARPVFRAERSGELVSKAERIARNDAAPGLDDEVSPEEARWAVAQYQASLRSPEALARDLGVKLRPLCRAMKALGCVLGFDDPDAALRPAPGHAAARRMRRAASRMDSYQIAAAGMP